MKGLYRYPEDYALRSASELDLALSAVPAYRDWRAADPGPQAPLDERYAALPLLNKAHLRAHGLEAFLAPGHALAERHAAGVPFIGLSAGSIMLSRQWIAWSDPDDDATAAPFDCLGFAPLLCDTHAEEDDWNELRALLEFQRPGTRGYGIPSRAMLRVHPDGRTESIGGDVVCLERTAVHQPPRDA